MKAWPDWIIFVLSFMAFSVLAEPVSPDSWDSSITTESILDSQTSQKFNSPDKLHLNRVIVSEETQLNNEILEGEADMDLSVFAGFKEFSSNNSPLIPVRTSAILFRDNLQTKPIYWLKAEFNSPDPALRTFADLRFKQDDSPWFIQSIRKSSSRLSGWKDGNSLYTASITYH